MSALNQWKFQCRLCGSVLYIHKRRYRAGVHILISIKDAQEKAHELGWVGDACELCAVAA